MIQSSRCSRVHHSSFKNLLIIPVGYGLQGNEVFFCIFLKCFEVFICVIFQIRDPLFKCFYVLVQLRGLIVLPLYAKLQNVLEVLNPRNNLVLNFHGSLLLIFCQCVFSVPGGHSSSQTHGRCSCGGCGQEKERNCKFHRRTINCCFLTLDPTHS